ncbi:hypothetical protein CEXT_801891, partial [Caerostris extrusa]
AGRKDDTNAVRNICQNHFKNFESLIGSQSLLAPPDLNTCDIATTSLLDVTDLPLS